jgi:hypothetical protein
VRRPDDHGDIEGALTQLTVGVSCHWTGIDQAGVRRDERDEVCELAWSVGGGQIAIHRGGEGRAGARIPAAGHGRRADASHLQATIYDCTYDCIYDLQSTSGGLHSRMGSGFFAHDRRMG